MGMHQGIDLSRFRKVSSDGKTTTLRHSKGHEVRIAHGALSPKMRDTINQMPAFMKDGGDRPAPIPGPSDLPEQTDESAPSIAPQAPQQEPEQQPQQEQAPPQQEAEQQQQQAAPAPQEVPPQAPQQPQQQTPQQAPQEKTVEQIAQEMNAHDLEFQRDAAMGHIKPETYKSLYGKKDTLGKIGTLFGLLVGGAGAGLTHTANPIMEMMDKEIERDVQAQQKSNENTQNWYRASQQHELQQQSLRGMETTRQGVAYENVGKAAKAEQEAILLHKHAVKNTPLTNRATNYALIGAGQFINDLANNIPPGPTRNKAQATAQHINNGIAQKVTKNNLNSAHQIKAAQPKTPPPALGAVKYDQLSNARQDAEYDLAHGWQPKVTPQEIDEIQKVEAPALEQNYANTNAYIKAYKQILNEKDRGVIDEKGYDAITGRISDELAKNLAGGRLLVGEANINAKRIFPTWQDFLDKNDRYKFDTTMKSLETERSKLGVLRSHKEFMNPEPKFENPYEQKKEQKRDDNMVMMQGPDGSTRLIPKNNVKSYLDRGTGYKVVK